MLQCKLVQVFLKLSSLNTLYNTLLFYHTFSADLLQSAHVGALYNCMIATYIHTLTATYICYMACYALSTCVLVS